MNKKSVVYIAGHNGLVGSAIYRLLQKKGYRNILVRSRKQLDLTNQQAVLNFFRKNKPEYIFMAAAIVGGIKANDDYPADFIHQNLMIQSNIIQAAYLNKAKKLLFLGSSCAYPRECPQPIKEEYLLSGPLEETNKPYAVAKIAGIITCQSFNRQFKTKYISVMPTNLYGPHDNFGLETSHALPALIRKIHDAKVENKKEVKLWGTGRARREFLFVDDLAEACFFLMQKYSQSDLINIGTGKDLTIGELARIIKKIVGFRGKIVYDKTKPDGTPQKLLNVSRLHKLGWKHKTELEEGIKKTYKWFRENQ
jgi:GDP-L-fucose synthase